MTNKVVLKDVLLIALIAVILGVVSFSTGLFSNILVPFLGPVGWLRSNLWHLVYVRTNCNLHLKKTGNCLNYRVISSFNWSNNWICLCSKWFNYCFLQGLGSELGFPLLKYKRFDWLPFLLSAIFTICHFYITIKLRLVILY